MDAWAIVPAKSPSRAKSRLRTVLDDIERARFATHLVEHVLGVLASCNDLAGVLVATDSDDIARLAHRYGAHARGDAGAESLAAVVDQALADVAGCGARTALVLMADLPLLDAADVRELLAHTETHDVVIVRDHRGRHTNALALTPPGAMATCFGRPDSFDAHCQAARARGLRLSVVESERVAFDVDGPGDLARIGGAAVSRRPSAAGT